MSRLTVFRDDAFLEELVNDAIWPDRSLDEYFDEYDALRSVTDASVQRFIAEHVRADRYVEVVVTPR